MKTITKLSLIAATVAAFASSAALAGDTQLENRLALQRQAAERNKTTTIAVYAGRHGVSQPCAMQDQRVGSHFELRTASKGQPWGTFVPNK